MWSAEHKFASLQKGSKRMSKILIVEDEEAIADLEKEDRKSTRLNSSHS